MFLAYNRAPDAFLIKDEGQLISLNEKEVLVSLSRTGYQTFFFISPLCGTCQLAEKMVKIVNELLPSMSLYKCNVNAMPELVAHWQVESVPCLLLIKNGEVLEKIYAFRDVHFLYKLLSEYFR